MRLTGFVTLIPSMKIVDDFHLSRPNRCPDKTDTPLVIDTNTVLTLAVTLEGFKAVSGRCSQEVQCLRRIELCKLSLSNGQEHAKAFGALAFEKRLRVFAAERPDHMFSLLRET